MKVTTDYISVGCNRGTSSSDVDEDGLVAFAAGKLVALWDTTDETHRGVHATLAGHPSNVTKVRFLPTGHSRPAVVSGDDSGHVMVWTPNGSEEVPGPSFSLAASFKGHSQSVSALAVLPRSEDGAVQPLLVTGGSDGLVKVWDVSGLQGMAGKQPELLQTIDFGGKLPLELALSRLPGSRALVLAVALTHRTIQIYTRSPSIEQSQASTSAAASVSFHQAIALEGHEDWVRCLSFSVFPKSMNSAEQDLMLASGSQDGYIRLWRVSRLANQDPNHADTRTMNGELDASVLNDEMLDEFERRMRGEGGLDADGQGGAASQLSTKAHGLRVVSAAGVEQYSVNLEALLIGHEGWVTNVHWSPPSTTTPPLLLSTAADNSMIIWTPPSSTSTIWLARHRFGEMGGKGLGLFGSLWARDKSPSGMSVIASTWNGGFQRWQLEEEAQGDMVDGEWLPEIAVTGHQHAVKDIAWDPAQEYLLSVSTDRTTRAHAPWTRDRSSTPTTTWAEIGRPQIHGYDMTCVAFLDRLRFVSGADEKVVRVFDAPKGFADSLKQLGVTKDDLGANAKSVGASVPPLGLSNRALGKAREPEPTTGKLTTMNEEHISISESLDKVPTEAVLASSTLWPEVEKLYGHGYELMTCAVSPARDLLATACKATSAEHAVVRLYDTTTWKQVGSPLEGHNLTITRITFSHDGRFILTCSRDRTWRLFESLGDGKGFDAVAAEKPHARIIWDCAWAPDDRYFATVSRDKQMKFWKRPEGDDYGKWQCALTEKMRGAPTAVAITRDPSAGRDLVAVGFEDGAIDIYAVQNDDTTTCRLLQHIGSDIAHVDQIHRLAWRSGPRGLQLASCSEDRSVRVLSLSQL